MNITILSSSEKPIYQQIFEQISAQILNGDLDGGYSLPSIRQAALELRISVITVKKAWEELERCGLINTVPGKGCFVVKFSSEEMLRLRNEMVMKQMASDASYYKSFGLTIEEVIELLKNVYSS